MMKDEKFKEMLQSHSDLLKIVDKRLIRNGEKMVETRAVFLDEFQKESFFNMMTYCGYNCEAMSNLDGSVQIKITRNK